MEYDEKYITITCFISPHQFWYKSAEDDTFSEVEELENLLTKRYINCSSLTRRFSPVKGNLVAVRYMPTRKFIRARIEEIISKQYTKVASYIVWAIDHGFPFETEEEHIRCLPEEFSYPIDRVRCGGLERIVPVEEEFDFIEHCNVMKVKEKWNAAACDILEKILFDAASVAFSENFNANGHFWGDLHIVNHRGHLFRASDHLIIKKLALRNVEKFKELCIKSNCTQMSVWNSSRGNEICIKNKYATDGLVPPMPERASSLNKSDIESAQMKVAAWSTHNKNATNYIGNSINCQDTTSVDSSNLYDTDLEDSVSKIGCKEDDNSSLSLKGIHLKKTKPPPPKPTLADFLLLDGNVDSEVSKATIPQNKSIDDGQKNIDKASTVSTHTRHLQELRLKGTAKKTESNDENSSIYDKDDSSSVAVSANRLKSPVLKSASSNTETTSCLKSFEDLQLSPDKSELHDNNKEEANNSMEATSTFSTNRAQYLKALRMKTASSKASDTSSNASTVNSKSIKQKFQKPKEQNMIPAGFDLANLNTYKDKNHWHCKSTTRDLNQSHNISQSSDSENQNQDFRFTRPNTEKYKKPSIGKIQEVEIKELNKKVLAENNAQLPTHPTHLSDSSGSSTVKSKTQLPKAVQKDHAKIENASNSSLLATSKNSDLDLNDSNTTFLSDSNTSQDSDDSRYSSAVSFLEEEENNLQKPMRLTPKPIKVKHLQTDVVKSKVNKNEDTSKNLSKILNSNNTKHKMIIRHEDDKIIRTKFVEHLVLAHSQIPLYTAEKIENVFLAPTVTTEMKRMYIDKVYRIQSYAWSHMIGGNGLFIVNGPNSGKTWSYLPPLCSSVTFAIQNRIVPSTSSGPMAIVLVQSASKAEKVGIICTRLLNKLEEKDAKTIISYGVQNLTNTKIQLMEACAILVTTPSNLLRLIEENEQKSPLFDPHRIQHIVIDDIDVMVSRTRSDITEVIKKLFKLVPKVGKVKKIQPQLVVTSTLYKYDLQRLIPFSNQPLLLIGDFLEAAVYGKAKIIMKLCHKDEKIESILQFINKHAILYEPLIILCNCESDVRYIVDCLITNGIPTIEFHSNSSLSDRQQIQEWKSKANQMKVLVCSDDVFAELEIQSARNLIHYSLAKTWTKFTYRFISLINSYENLVVKGFDGPPPEHPATSLILLDEDNNSELPRLIEFFKNHNQIDRVHPDVLDLSKRIITQREMARCSESTQLCSSLFEFGECNDARCGYRHFLVIADVKQNHSEKFQCGDLRLQILNVFSPTHFSARILEHRATQVSNWRVVRQSNMSSFFASKLNYFYDFNPDNLMMHYPAKLNDICICKRNERYYRARVLDASEIKSSNIIQSVQIKLKLIDIGDIIYAKSDEIYICHNQFLNFPAQAVDIRLMGVLPFDNERVWDSNATTHVKHLIKDNLAKNECVHVSIDFALDDAIWVNNVIIMEQLPTLKSSTFKLNLKRHLVNKKYGILDADVVAKVHKIIEEQSFGYILDKNENIDSDDKSTPKILDSGNEHSEKNEDQTPEIEQNNAVEQTSVTKEKTSGVKFATKSNAENINSEKDGGSDKISEKSGKKLPNQLDNSEHENDTAEPLPDVCDFNEVIKCLQRTIQLDALDFDIKNEKEAEAVQEYIHEMDKLCNAALDGKYSKIHEINKNCDDKKPRCIMEKRTESTLKAKENISIMQSKKSQETETESFIDSLPRLLNLHPRPFTEWYETNFMIILSIHAPDVEDYYLEVSQDLLYFTAHIDGVQKVLLLNFLGTIEPNLFSHEIRGLNVIVRLVKSLYMKWPRLLKQKEKMPWLKYNFNMINTKEMDDFLPQQLLSNVLHSNLSRPVQSSDEESDNEYNFYETYTPIFNKEDIHDPMGSELM